MSRFFLTVLVAMVLFCAVGCAGPIQYTQAHNVNQGEDGIRAFRIDGESVVLYNDISDFGWTYMLLERTDRGVRYTVTVDLYAEGVFDRSCRGSGFFYDSGEMLVNFDLIGNGRVLVITDQLRPFIERWNEVLRECR